MRIFILLCLTLSGTAGAHEFFSTKVTWTREISRIIAKRCLECHSEGRKAFSLATYADARPWAKAIKEEVLNRRMPPWGAAKGFGDFVPDHALSQEEISLIADWVEGGAPEGDRLLLPPMRPTALPQTASIAKRKVPLPAAALPAQLRIRGIIPGPGVAPGTQLAAQRPDGTVEPLIWIVEPRAATGRTFALREPITLPKASRIVKQGSGAFSILVD
ncbi:hypothetical protein F183_A47840 [Bryobacterales bacterium F-183]|nr:hypothetical protein F183_A47840 [Bryobacterales bacterium F-183]